MAKIKDILLPAYEEVFNGKAWHGATLYKTLKKLSLEQAKFSQTTEGYTAWQVALHCAYWKWSVRRKILGPGNDGFPRQPVPRGRRDWPAMPEQGTLEEWKSDLDLLVTEHARLLALIARMTDKKLLTLIDGDLTPARLISGITAHDVYHTAQIRNMGVPGLR